ncbi:MAG: hypothetical protein Q9222_004324 [Ikaeria aurantiellina]
MAPSPPPQASKDKPKRKPAGRADGGYKIAGTVLPWDLDIDLDRPVPTPLFPSYRPSSPAPLTPAEKTQVAAFRAFRSRIHEGPYYTVLDHDARVGKTNSRAAAAASFDPFEGMPTYSQKYVKKRRQLPKLDARPYVLNYFPKELWQTLDPKNHKVPTSAMNGLRKQSSTNEKRSEQKSILKQEGVSNDDDGATGGDRDPDEEAMNIVADDDFDEDDDDGGDYNAEQYFDDGGDDAGDDMDGDVDGGGEYF